jgi:hypothetical protein
MRIGTWAQYLGSCPEGQSGRAANEPDGLRSAGNSPFPAKSRPNSHSRHALPRCTWNAAARPERWHAAPREPPCHTGGLGRNGLDEDRVDEDRVGDLGGDVY